MIDKILCTQRLGETRIAMLEKERIWDVSILRDSHCRVGSIYLGRVVSRVPSTSAFFVDIGDTLPAFLSTNDVLAEGQIITVQVKQEARKNKGCKLTNSITFPANYVVYSPFRAGASVSRRISDVAERDRLKEFLKNIIQPDEGIVARSFAEGVSFENMEKEVVKLRNEWNLLKKNSKTAKAPSLLFKSQNPLFKILIEHHKTLEAVYFDDMEIMADAKDSCESYVPKLSDCFHFYSDSSLPLFEYYDVEKDIEEALSLVVSLPSGGRIIIQETAAFTAVDVDTGSSTGVDFFKTNLEAVTELARQMRIRNLSGQIIVDVVGGGIGKKNPKILKAMRKALVGDSVASRVIGETPLGNIEIIRDRRGSSLAEILTEPCVKCESTGHIQNTETTALLILQKFQRIIEVEKKTAVEIKTSSKVASCLQNELRQFLAQAEYNTGVKPVFNVKMDWSNDRFEII